MRRCEELIVWFVVVRAGRCSALCRADWLAGSQDGGRLDSQLNNIRNIQGKSGEIVNSDREF